MSQITKKMWKQHKIQHVRKAPRQIPPDLLSQEADIRDCGICWFTANRLTMGDPCPPLWPLWGSLLGRLHPSGKGSSLPFHHQTFGGRQQLRIFPELPLSGHKAPAMIQVASKDSKQRQQARAPRWALQCSDFCQRSCSMLGMLSRNSSQITKPFFSGPRPECYRVAEIFQNSKPPFGSGRNHQAGIWKTCNAVWLGAGFFFYSVF